MTDVYSKIDQLLEGNEYPHYPELEATFELLIKDIKQQAKDQTLEIYPGTNICEYLKFIVSWGIDSLRWADENPYEAAMGFCVRLKKAI